MKKTTRKSATRARRDRDTMRPEYDFSGGIRGKYAARYRRGSNVVVLDPDIAQAFPDARAVNRALRALLEVAPKRSGKAGRARSA